MEEAKLSWKFPREYWVANIIELFERAAYYGMFIVLAVYLTREVGFTDVETGWVTGLFASLIYLSPTFTGTLADKMGFRSALLLAFALLSGGYFLLGLWPTKLVAVTALAFIMLGGSFVKPIITGTVAKASDERHRARAYSIFYMMVNIGAFLGKTIAKPLRVELGLRYINFYAAGMAFIALIIVYFMYKDLDTTGKGKSLKEALDGLIRVLKNVRFMALILIVAGFWAIQHQLYATMPKYTLRLVGEHASPEWLANVNPLVVVLFVVPVTHLVRKIQPVSSIGIALLIIPFSALSIALSPVLTAITGDQVSIFGLFTLHPITVALIFGIALQGLAETFLSPRFLEYASKQAPKGEEGLYLGYSHLTTFFANLFAFVSSGYLLDKYCPDPRTLTELQKATAYEHAHYIWYFYAGVGLLAFVLLMIYKYVCDTIDRRRAQQTA
ncbi:MFS transporter [Caldithrix abyssi]|uniref:Dipeptide/tripeptide permease n=1 Tax=Caldithrix abyssi DSM 13497 TaxID=880073 RepID=H1XTV4_CALAY|nr:MFS transporter [Caldithrix abyssi]APF18742.1 Dipeptide/tripeptide permease [Caldithrix abyssi DSM 13497]EHO42721.1 major facilitator superfamily MFS_1 [Caldithrix abyssi DSM 13497]